MPESMNTDQARIVDPVLTSQARGYTNAQFIGHHLFPAAMVPKRAGKRIEFNKESFRIYNSKRSPGAGTKRISFGYEGLPFTLEQSSLEGQVPWEHIQETRDMPGIDLAAGSVRMVQDSIALEKEVDQATKARDLAAYDDNHKVTLTGGDQWSHADSNPKDDVKTAKEAIRATSGREPNTLVLGKKVFNALDDHPKIMEKFKYTSSDSLTLAMLANYFGVQHIFVGEAVWADEDGVFHDVWGLDAILAWVPTAGANMLVPSYGYTYQLTGMPIVEEGYFDKNSKSFYYPYTDEWSAEIVGAEAGFLIKNAVASS